MGFLHKPQLRYFSYISHSKVSQLYEQLKDFDVEKKSVKRSKGGDASAEAGVDSVLSLIKGNLKIGGSVGQEVEETGSVTIVGHRQIVY